METIGTMIEGKAASVRPKPGGTFRSSQRAEGYGFGVGGPDR